MIYIGKIVTGLLAVLLAVCILTQTACAATPAEIQDQITACQVIKQTAHEMAECARQLEYPEDHIIIQCAQEKWREAAAKEQELMRELSKQLDASGPVVPATTWTGSRLTRRGGIDSTEAVLAKYQITELEYEEICDRLTDALHIGYCALCV